MFAFAVTQRLSRVLWSQLDTEQREQHVSCVDLFYRLHCLAPSASICEDIICQALLHKDQVHVVSFFFCVSFLVGRKDRFNRGSRVNIGRKTKILYVFVLQAVRLEALHRFTVLWHLTRENQCNRTMSLSRSFDRSVHPGCYLRCIIKYIKTFFSFLFLWWGGIVVSKKENKTTDRNRGNAASSHEQLSSHLPDHSAFSPIILVH